MGCKWCVLGVNCDGSLGMDDLEAACDCSCHDCPDCGSPYCYKMGGPDPCQAELDSRAYDYNEFCEEYMRVSIDRESIGR